MVFVFSIITLLPVYGQGTTTTTTTNSITDLIKLLQNLKEQNNN
jgi:hypothetical protein